MLTFAKGITNGAAPMGGVLVRDTIHDAFMSGPEHAVELTPRLYLFGASAVVRRGTGDARYIPRRKSCSSAPASSSRNSPTR